MINVVQSCDDRINSVNVYVVIRVHVSRLPSCMLQKYEHTYDQVFSQVINTLPGVVHEHVSQPLYSVVCGL